MEDEQIVAEEKTSAPVAITQELTEEDLEKKIEESRQRALSKKRDRELMI